MEGWHWSCGDADDGPRRRHVGFGQRLGFPNRRARLLKRPDHPQADAINICGWMGIITIVLWPIAMVWAYLLPSRPITGPDHGVVEDRAALTAKLQQVSQRIAAIESKLPKPTAGGA